MTATRTNLLLRNDTILGVCEAIGEDFGFNPNWLRVALCVALFFSPVGVIAGYLAAGLVVVASRLLAPDKVEAAPEAVAHSVEANDSAETAIAA